MYLGKLSDNDKRYGRVTVGTNRKGDNDGSIYCFLESGYNEPKEPNEEYQYYTTLTVKFGKLCSIRLHLPTWLKPYRQKVEAKTWKQETIDRLGRNWYYSHRNRKYGFYLSSTGVSVTKGMESVSTHYSFPWREFTYIRTDLYDHNDNIVGVIPNGHRNDRTQVTNSYYKLKEIRDDSELVASIHKVDRVYYKFGGWLLWLGKLLPKQHFPSLDIWFSEETGSEKGSWKGGIIGSGINLLDGESQVNALRRYCDNHEMVIVAPAGFGAGKWENPVEKKEVDQSSDSAATVKTTNPNEV